MRCEMLLPFPPTVNSIWRKSRSGMYRHVKYLTWLEEAHRAVEGTLPADVTFDPVHVELRLYGRSRAKWDIDNRAKVILDFLQGRFLFDDAQVDKLTIRRGPLRKGLGGAWVILETMEQGALVCPAWPTA